MHEPQKENLARVILFLTLFCETGLSARERMETYLDLYGNCLIRDKTSQYLQDINRELIQLVTEDDKCSSVIKDLINFETLKFKDRDDIEDIFSSYHNKHPFDVEKLRDTRIRAHYKDRYDHRRNLVDWDYQFGIKDFTKTVNQQEYRAWRLNGIAFETRLATGTIPNRTMGSYVDGKTVSLKFYISLPFFNSIYRKKDMTALKSEAFGVILLTRLISRSVTKYGRSQNELVF